jgi:putative transposase
MREVMSLQGSLSIERMWELTRVSRASFYRSFRDKHLVEEEMEVRSAIQQIAVEHRRATVTAVLQPNCDGKGCR